MSSKVVFETIFFFLERKLSISDSSSQSRIPVRVAGESQSPSPVKQQIPAETSSTNSPAISQQSTPTRRKLPIPGGDRQVVKEPMLTKKEERQAQSMPWEKANVEDSEVCVCVVF